MHDFETTIKNRLDRISKECSETLSSYLSPTGGPLLCALMWARESGDDILVSSGPLARMDRLSRHKQLEAYAFEKARQDDMRQLICDISTLPAGAKMQKLSIDIYHFASNPSASMYVEINDFSVCSSRSQPEKLAKSIVSDLS